MKLKEAIARLLVITMSLSLFSSCVLAVETDIPDDVSIADQSCNDDPLGERDVSDVVPLVVEDSSQDATESIQEAEPLAEEDVSDETEALSDTDSPGQEYPNEKKIVAKMGQGDDTSLLETMAIGQDTFNNKLNELRSKYPDYSTWTESYSGGSECWGFARLVADYVFEGSWRNWQQVYSIGDVKAGDILQYGNTSGYGHTVFVTSVSGNAITFVDCNGNGNYSNGREVRYCGVKWDNTVEKGAMLFGRYNFSYLLSSPGFNEPIEYTGKCGKNATWNYDVEKHTLTISGKGKVTISDYEDDKYYIWKDLHAVFEEEYERTGTIEKIKLVVNEGITDLSIEGAEGYKSLKFPKSLKVLSSLGGSELPSTFIIPKSVTSIKDDCLFFNVSAFKVEKGNTKYSAKDGVLFNKDKTVLIRYPWEKKGKRYSIPNTVRKIGCNAFDPTYLKELIIPSSVKTIGRNAFWYCYYKLYFQGLPPKMNDIFEEEMDEAVIYYPKRYKKQWEARIKEFKSCGIKVKSWKG